MLLRLSGGTSRSRTDLCTGFTGVGGAGIRLTKEKSAPPAGDDQWRAYSG